MQHSHFFLVNHRANGHCNSHHTKVMPLPECNNKINIHFAFSTGHGEGWQTSIFQCSLLWCKLVVMSVYENTDCPLQNDRRKLPQFIIFNKEGMLGFLLQRCAGSGDVISDHYQKSFFRGWWAQFFLITVIKSCRCRRWTHLPPFALLGHRNTHRVSWTATS